LDLREWGGMYDSLPLNLGRKKYSCNFFRDFSKVIPLFDPTPTAECYETSAINVEDHLIRVFQFRFLFLI
jgi:hypothetical protein